MYIYIIVHSMVGVVQLVNIVIISVNWITVDVII